MTTISERLRQCGDRSEIEMYEDRQEAADTIDALVAALDAAASSAGFQYMMHETRDQIDTALALARKGG